MDLICKPRPHKMVNFTQTKPPSTGTLPTMSIVPHTVALRCCTASSDRHLLRACSSDHNQRAQWFSFSRGSIPVGPVTSNQTPGQSKPRSVRLPRVLSGWHSKPVVHKWFCLPQHRFISEQNIQPERQVITYPQLPVYLRLLI